MAITVVGTPTNSGDAADATSHSVAVPTGAAADDIAVVYLGQWNAGGVTPTVTAPSGFAQKGSNFSNGPTGGGDGFARNSVWWKRLTGADSGTYAFSYSASMWTTVQCVLFRGCATSGDPWDVMATPITNLWTSTIDSISLTNTDANGALVWWVYNDTAATHTSPTGFTEAADNDCATTGYKILSASGSQTASGGTVSTATTGGVWMGALLSSGGGGGGGTGPPGRPPIVMPSLAATQASSW